MTFRSILPLTLVGLISCSKYPKDANLSVYADSVRYTICGDVNGGGISELGAISSPSGLYDLEQEIRIEIALEQGEEPRVLYEGFYLDEKGKRVAPGLPQLLDGAGVIGADCGFHHPDSHDPCFASVKVSEPVTMRYRISPFPGEKNTDDNTSTISLSVEDLEGHAQALSSIWATQEQKEVEEERRTVAEKQKGIK